MRAVARSPARVDRAGMMGQAPMDTRREVGPAAHSWGLPARAGMLAVADTSAARAAARRSPVPALRPAVGSLLARVERGAALPVARAVAARDSVRGMVVQAGRRCRGPVYRLSSPKQRLPARRVVAARLLSQVSAPRAAPPSSVCRLRQT